MKHASYWHATAPAFRGAAEGGPEGHYDVAVIGGGFTGLSAARRLADAGARVAVIEARTVLAGASGLNGGHVNNGLAHNYLAARRRFGVEGAQALYRAFDAAVDTVERIVRDEGIDCGFRRSGKLKLAAKPSHVDGMRRNFEALHAEADPDTAFLSAPELAPEVGSAAFHGAMLQRKSAMMHMGRFGAGLAEAATRHGAEIFENAPVTARSAGRRQRLATPRGTITADAVFLATGAYTSGPFGWVRRRIVPVGSVVIATEPLAADRAAEVMPGNRTCVTSRHIGHYFRLGADNRLIFGGRARFAASNGRTEHSAGILHRSLLGVFPQLGDARIEYCWGGLVDMTRDRFPRAGERDGLHFAMGYSGHGTQMSVHMGEVMADLILGRDDRNPWRDLPWRAIPGHFGTPWFLPLVGGWFRLRDRLC